MTGREHLSARLLSGPTAARAVLCRTILFVIVMAMLPAYAQAETAASAAPNPRLPTARYLFIENEGQYAPEARFLLKTSQGAVWLAQDAIWLTVYDARRGEQASSTGGANFRITFSGANAQSTLEPFGAVSASVSYLVGEEASQWRTNLPVWSGVRYRDLYPGVDLVVGGEANGAVPWRFESRGGVTPPGVRMRVEGGTAAPMGATALSLEAGERSIVLSLPTWSWKDKAGTLASYAVPEGTDGLFVLSPGQRAEEGPSQTPAVVDSGDLLYMVTLGSSAADAGYSVVSDYLGNAYVTGETQATGFPTTPGVFDSSYNGGASDAFVAKYNADGTALLYATYLGGSASDIGWGIAVERDLAFVVGETSSSNFPVIGGAVAGTDIFVAALNSNGSSLRYVTRLGGDNTDYGYGIALEGSNTYIAGQTYSTNLAGTNCSAATVPDALVAKLGPTGAPVYTTCLGGSDSEVGYGVAVRSEEVYLTGESFSPNFPGGLTANGGDILVARFNKDGVLAVATLTGGSAEDIGNGVAVDDAGNVYIAGTTGGIDPNDPAAVPFPVTLGTPAYGGGVNDGVVLKFLPALTLSFGTYLGGADEDYLANIAVDTVQGLYVAGTTLSMDFPTTDGAYDTGSNGGFDPFVARLHLGSAAADKLTYSTYLGGPYDDWGSGSDTDTGGNVFSTGSMQSSLNPMSSNAFVTKVELSSPPAAPAVTITRSGSDVSLSWTAVAFADQYQVIRSGSPYFKPGQGTFTLPLEDPTLTAQADKGALSQVDAYFYVVKAVKQTAPSMLEAGRSSAQKGKFSFQLKPGG